MFVKSERHPQKPPHKPLKRCPFRLTMLSFSFCRVNRSYTYLRNWLFSGKFVQKKEYVQNNNKHEDTVNHMNHVGFWTLVTATIGHYLLIYLAFVNRIFLPSPEQSKEKNREGYVPLYSESEYFFKFFYFNRAADIFQTPISGAPGAQMIVKDRTSKDNFKFELTGKESECINVSSYSYLGFAGTSNKCARETIEALTKYGWASCSTNREYGVSSLQRELETLVAEYIQVEDAVVFGTGFAANALNLPCLMSKECLALSDEKNHSSLILGLRLSKATIRVFKHNDTNHLNALLKEAVLRGQPNGRPWKKIFIVAEGIYSMDGTLVNLPEMIRLKKKYKAYIYLDEAHCVGAIGSRGAGSVDIYGCDPKDVDVLMGSFSKSFGSAGGFIAGSKEVVDYLRATSYAACYGSSMSPPVAQQTISALQIMLAKDGSNQGRKKIKALAKNTIYFRRRLQELGIDVRGHEFSPIVPVMTYQSSKFVMMVRELLKRRVAAAGVGFPVTPLLEGRIRFCLSAVHTKDQLDYVLKQIDDLADIYHLKYVKNTV